MDQTINTILDQPLIAINLGLSQFANSLEDTKGRGSPHLLDTPGRWR